MNIFENYLLNTKTCESRNAFTWCFDVQGTHNNGALSDSILIFHITNFSYLLFFLKVKLVFPNRESRSVL